MEAWKHSFLERGFRVADRVSRPGPGNPRTFLVPSPRHGHVRTSGPERGWRGSSWLPWLGWLGSRSSTSSFLCSSDLGLLSCVEPSYQRPGLRIADIYRYLAAEFMRVMWSCSCLVQYQCSPLFVHLRPLTAVRQSITSPPGSFQAVNTLRLDRAKPAPCSSAQ